MLQHDLSTNVNMDEYLEHRDSLLRKADCPLRNSYEPPTTRSRAKRLELKVSRRREAWPQTPSELVLPSRSNPFMLVEGNGKILSCAYWVNGNLLASARVLKEERLWVYWSYDSKQRIPVSSVELSVSPRVALLVLESKWREKGSTIAPLVALLDARLRKRAELNGFLCELDFGACKCSLRDLHMPVERLSLRQMPKVPQGRFEVEGKSYSDWTHALFRAKCMLLSKRLVSAKIVGTATYRAVVVGTWDMVFDESGLLMVDVLDSPVNNLMKLNMMLRLYFALVKIAASKSALRISGASLDSDKAALGCITAWTSYCSHSLFNSGCTRFCNGVSWREAVGSFEVMNDVLGRCDMWDPDNALIWKFSDASAYVKLHQLLNYTEKKLAALCT